MEASEYLRGTICLDGVFRRLCEECALDTEHAKQQQRVERQRQEASKRA
jgi:hypothetical protein